MPDIRQGGTVISERQETNEVSPTIALLTPLREFSAGCNAG